MSAETTGETSVEPAPAPILEMRRISKEFPGVKALSEVSISVGPGQIHAVAGENGAGKSTLMKVLSGVYPYGTYQGDIVYRGQLQRFRNVGSSEAVGIVTIHQEFALIPQLSITENIFLGSEITHAGVIDWGEQNRRATELLALVGLREDPETQIRHLGVGKQQLVEIARALHRDVQLLILDEPTSTLNGTDSQHLLDLILGLKECRVSSIIISHKLNEIEQIADSITILRDGHAIETLNVKAHEV
ncbi:MAG: ATP-binding cassette domain-containing protein, partial [Microbacterium sp.]|uniref:ATP-binding cassette domain-containing protein n=1 Tax=Microbacterium sp. TaxID=51671 RepID=UPI001D4F0B25